MDNLPASSVRPTMAGRGCLGVRGNILSCRLTCGAKFQISDICATSGFGLGKVREALSRLTSEGLMQGKPSRGFRVASIITSDLVDLTRAFAD